MEIAWPYIGIMVAFVMAWAMWVVTTQERQRHDDNWIEVSPRTILPRATEYIEIDVTNPERCAIIVDYGAREIVLEAGQTLMLRPGQDIIIKS